MGPLNPLLVQGCQCRHLDVGGDLLDGFGQGEVRPMADVDRDVFEIIFFLDGLLDEELDFFSVACSQLDKVELLFADGSQNVRPLLLEDFYF